MEQDEVKRVSSKTTLKVGAVETPVGLYKTTGDTAKAKWVKATPEGNAFTTEQFLGDEKFVPEPVEDTADPFAAKDEEVEAEKVEVVEKIVDQVTDKVYGLDEIRTGFKDEEGNFHDLTEELEKAEELSRLEEMSVVGFIRREVVPRSRIIGSYYVGVEDPGAAKVLAVLDAAMREKARAAIVRWTKRKGQTVGVMVPDRSGALIVLEMAFFENCRRPNEKCLAHTHVKPTETAVEHAATLIEAMSVGGTELDEVRDDRKVMEDALVRAALAGGLDEFEPEPEQVADEMADLEKILAASV